MRYRAALIPLLLVISAGCRLALGPDLDTTIVVSGRAVADGQPIVGLSVTLDESLAFGTAPVTRTTTNNTGAFSIMYDPGHTITQRI